MTIVWSWRAVRHLAAIRAFIGQDNPDAAKHVAGRILELADLLADFPQMGRVGRVAGTRELVITGTPYIVAYRLKRGAVEIIAVLHGRRRWPKRL